LKNTTKYEKCRQLQLKIEGYSHEVRMETRGNEKAQSILTMFENRQDDNQKPDGLLEEILESIVSPKSN